MTSEECEGKKKLVIFKRGTFEVSCGNLVLFESELSWFGAAGDGCHEVPVHGLFELPYSEHSKLLVL